MAKTKIDGATGKWKNLTVKQCGRLHEEKTEIKMSLQILIYSPGQDENKRVGILLRLVLEPSDGVGYPPRERL